VAGRHQVRVRPEREARVAWISHGQQRRVKAGKRALTRLSAAGFTVSDRSRFVDAAAVQVVPRL
jgi:hypothetical protein